MNVSYFDSVNRCMQWVNTQMLTFDNGYYGIYERIRIDEHTRTNWSRPDSNAEYLRVLMMQREFTGNTDNDTLIENLINWLVKTQDTEPLSVWNGSFPFYLVDGHTVENHTSATLYQNDNGKILTIMCQLYSRYGDERFLTIAHGIAKYWCAAQQEDGTFGIIDSKNVHICAKGTCFVHWLTCGLYLLYAIVKQSDYLICAKKGMRYIKASIKADGRSKTSYEMIKVEDWRPVSSETSMAFYCFNVAFMVTKEPDLLSFLTSTGEYIVRLQKECGAIANCIEACLDYSLQTSTDIADLVYTQGFALQAFVLAYQNTQDEKWLCAAKKLADFLVSIQCQNESPLWDGGWRGSYNFVKKVWDGRANQNNTIDEGGQYSVYTGWCCSNIMYGLQQLYNL